MSKNRRELPQTTPQTRRDTIQDVLWRWVGNDLYSVSELAAIADCTAKTMYAYLEERRNFPWKRARRIARDASRRHGLNGLARLLFDRARWELNPRGDGEANGRLDDDLGPMTEALGLARLYHREGDCSSMSAQLEAAERELNDLKAERDRL